MQYISDQKYNVFKKGKIFMGQRKHSLDNVDVSDELYPPCIYDLKPLRIAELVPISFQTFYVLMLQPRKIRESDLKTYFCEQNNVLSFFREKKMDMQEDIDKHSHCHITI